MKLSKNKKGLGFDVINAGMISFITFIMIVVLTVVLISITTKTSMICQNNIVNHTITYFNGACYDCAYNGTQVSVYNTTDGKCYNGSASAEIMTTAGVLMESNQSQYLAMKDMRDAAKLPAQFSSIVVIALIIVGILALLATVGYGIYQRMKR